MLSLLTTVESLSGLTQSRKPSLRDREAVFQQTQLVTRFVVIRVCHLWACGPVGTVGARGRTWDRPAWHAGTAQGEGSAGQEGSFGAVRASEGFLCKATLLPELGLLGPPLCLRQPRSLVTAASAKPGQCRWPRALALQGQG